MSRFVRHICNKKNVPALRKDCERCEEYNPCAKNGKWCFVGALIAEYDQNCPEFTMPLIEAAVAPVLRDMPTVTINCGDGMCVDALREDIKRRLERDFYRASGLVFGG